MNNKAASKRRCAAMLAVLAVLVSFVGLLIIWPLMAQNRAFDKEMADQVALLMRLRNLAARQSGLEEELQQFRLTADESHYYIKAQTPALGAAELQKRVKRIIDANQGKLVSTQALPIQDDGKAVRIAIRVRMSIRPDALGGVLHDLEGGRPPLFVENLSVRARQTRRRRKQTSSPKQSIDVHYDLAGYMRGTSG